jgi:tetratricopeptide (TPR) repeat protein
MKRFACAMALLAMSLLMSGGLVFAQQHGGHEQPAPKPATLMSGLSDLHHPVSTTNPEAQQFFDQGLRLIYAFNHEQAALSFQQAAKLDPRLAMAWWGVAEAIGPNYNDPADPDRYRQAHEAIEKAGQLAANAAPNEKAYIAAMALRFPADPKADHRLAAERYRNAMSDVVKQFPDDLDAATLFAEAAMNLHPWGLWRADGTPIDGTEDIIATLESVLRRDPNHIGAIHYYIHTVEASPNPERALAAANRLAALAPAAGHLVHMPGHIYIRTGDFETGVSTNQLAAQADRDFMKANGPGNMYSMMYYSHNLHFIAACASMNGRYDEAHKAAAMLAAHVGPVVKDVPPLESFLTVPIAVEVRFQRWDEILKMPQPAAAMAKTTAYWHFARGMALVATGKVTEGQSEYKALKEYVDKVPADEVFAEPIGNKTKDVLTIAVDVFAAKIALATQHSGMALQLLNQAVMIQDKLKYDEPPDWYYPVRESLGAVLLLNHQADEAEKVFREDLQRNPCNPRSLFGLSEALRAQNRSYDAQFVEKQFQANWKGGETKLKIADLT